MILCHFYKPPLFENPPYIEIPDPQKDHAFYGEIYVKYPGSSAPVAMNFGYAFCEMAKKPPIRKLKKAAARW